MMKTYHKEFYYVWMKEITAIWPPVSYISSSSCILLGSCCFNLWEFPCGWFHTVAWLTMRAGWIIGPVAANKLLLLSDPVSVCVRWRVPLNACVLSCLFTNVCTTPSYLFPKRKWNPLCVCSLPDGELFLFITSPALPCCNRRAKSLLWTEVLTGYYFPVDYKNSNLVPLRHSPLSSYRKIGCELGRKEKEERKGA